MSAAHESENLLDHLTERVNPQWLAGDKQSDSTTGPRSRRVEDINPNNAKGAAVARQAEGR